MEYGVINSPYDERDYTLDMLTDSTETLPTSYKTETTVPVLSQGSTSTCVACALATCRYIQEELQEGSARKFSVNYIYGNRETTTEGMIPRNALETLLNYGDCHWDDLPGYSDYATANESYNANKETYDDLAYPYKINSYYRLYSVEEIKTAVFKLGCAVISYNTRKNLNYPDSKGYVEYDETQEVGDRHLVTIIGWTEDNHWIVLNSWGDDYADNGICYVAFDYPFNECWTMVDDNRFYELRLERDVEKASGVFLGVKKRYL